jgi:digalactosyldiacylglycerol synthase
MGTNDTPPTAGGADGAFSFISKGWREERETEAADLRLMRARTDRGLEQLLASAPPLVAAGAPIAELEFVRRRIQELRRQYSSRAALGGCWSPGPAAGASLRVDFSGITVIATPSWPRATALGGGRSRGGRGAARRRGPRSGRW